MGRRMTAEEADDHYSEHGDKTRSEVWSEAQDERYTSEDERRDNDGRQWGDGGNYGEGEL